MLNKAKMGLTAGSGKVNMTPSGQRDSTGNGVQTFGDKELMERNQVVGSPEKAAVVKSDG